MRSVGIHDIVRKGEMKLGGGLHWTLQQPTSSKHSLTQEYPGKRGVKNGFWFLNTDLIPSEESKPVRLHPLPVFIQRDASLSPSNSVKEYLMTHLSFLDPMPQSKSFTYLGSISPGVWMLIKSILKTVKFWNPRYSDPRGDWDLTVNKRVWGIVGGHHFESIPSWLKFRGFITNLVWLLKDK